MERRFSPLFFTAFVVFSISLIACKTQAIGPQCSSKSDLGSVNCVYISRYTPNWQWATCLTEDYIMRVSKQRGLQHVCTDPSAVQCWYQCQLEVHNKNSGPVDKACQCTQGATATTPTASTQVTLPPECFSPSGDDCSWYRNCLEKRYPCSGTSDDYALGFGEKFCNLYGQNQALFSKTGQVWIDQVRKCLQVKLVYLLRPFETASCARIRREAFASHTPCYVNSPTSVCSLTCTDFARIFFLVFSNTPWGAMRDVVLQTAGTFVDCFPSTIQKASRLKCPFDVAKTSLRVKGFLSNVRDQITDVGGAVWRDVTQQVSDTFSKTLNWAEKGIQWISVPEKVEVSFSGSTPRRRRDTNEEATANLTIRMFIVDKATINSTVQSQNLTKEQRDGPAKAIAELAEAIRTQPLLQNIVLSVNSSRLVAQARSFSQCTDLQCNGTNPNITDVQPLSGLGSHGACVNATHFLPLVFLAIMLTFCHL